MPGRPRPTRNAGTAVERLAEALGGAVETTGRGVRRVTIPERPGDEHGPVTIEGPVTRVLYALLNAATSPVDLGGFGKDYEDLRPVVNLVKVPQKGVSAHEHFAFCALTGTRAFK